jgi:hypothetical protein
VKQAFVIGVELLAVMVLVINVRRAVRVPSRDQVVGVLTMMLLVVGGVAYEAGWLGSSRDFQAIGFLAIAALALGLMVRRSATRESTRLVPLLFVPAGISTCMFFVNALASNGSSSLDVFARLAPCLLWLLVGVLLSLSRVQVETLQAALGVALALSFVLLPFSSGPWRACDQFKCGAFDAIFVGAFRSENYLGQLACLFVLLSVTRPGWKRRLPDILFGGTVLLATESRTSQLALLVSFGFALLVSRVSDRATRTRLCEALVLLIVALGLVLLFNASNDWFSNRGRIWNMALAALGPNWATGLGLDTWEQLQAVGALPPLFPHSVYLLLLFGGGLGALLLFAGTLLACAHRVGSTRSDTFTGLSLVVFVAFVGITEVAWNPLTLDGHSFMLVLVLITATRLSAVEAPGSSRRAALRRARGGHALGDPLVVDALAGATTNRKRPRATRGGSGAASRVRGQGTEVTLAAVGRVVVTADGAAGRDPDSGVDGVTPATVLQGGGSGDRAR